MVLETEFNGTLERADLLTNRVTVFGNLFDNSDKDYFVYKNAPIGTLEVSFDSPTTASTYQTFVLQVIDASDNIIYGEESGSNIDFNFAVEKAGNYYFLVSPDYHNENQYSLTVSHTEDTSSHSLLTEAENNNSYELSSSITSSEANTGQLYSADDVDFFKFTANRTGTVSIQFDAPAGGALTYDSFIVELLDFEQNLMNKEETSHSASFDTEIGETGDFYVKVSSRYPYEDGIYSLAIGAPFNASSTISMPYEYYYGLQGESLTASLEGVIYSDPENDSWTHTAFKLISQESSDKQITATYSGSELPYDTWQNYENGDISNISYTRPNKFAINEVKTVAWDGTSWSNELSTYLVSVADIIPGDDTDNEITTTIGFQDSYVINGLDGYDKLDISFANKEIDTSINYSFSKVEDFDEQEIFLLNFEEITYRLPDEGWTMSAQEDLIQRVYFGSENDTVNAAVDGDFYFGGNGYNSYIPYLELETINYNATDKTVTSAVGVDYVENFRVSGTAGDDEFYGRTKDTPTLLDWFTVFLDEDEFPYETIDMFVPLGGNNKLIGAAGIDVAWYYGNGEGISVDLGQELANHSDGNTDTLVNIEMIVATDYDDVLIGDDQDNLFAIYNGNDNLYGGEGSDTVSFYASGIRVSLQDGTAQTLDLESSPNFGNKSLTSIENLVGTEGADQLIGDEYQNYLAGDDGDDEIDGGGGDDYLIGGIGNDTLTGGLGNDQFVYYLKTNAPIGSDTITDFSFAEDSVYLIGYDEDQVVRTLNSLGDDVIELTEDGPESKVTIKSVAISGSLNIPLAKSKNLIFGEGVNITNLDINSLGKGTSAQATFTSVKVDGITDLNTQISSASSEGSPISISDVVTQLRDIVGLETLTGKAKAAADIDNDGQVNISDVVSNLRHIVGLDQIDTFDLVTDNGFTINALAADSVGNLSLVINGDADQSHTEWTALTDTSVTGTNSDDVIDLNSSRYKLARQTISVDGGAGNDVITGSDADENIFGGVGNDKLLGGGGTNTLTGGAGADEFQFNHNSLNTAVTDFTLSEGDSLKFINQSDEIFSFDQSSIRSNASNDGLLIDYSADGSTGTFDLSMGLKDVSLYINGALKVDTANGSWFNRSLEVNGLELVVSGDVGGQAAVPDDWVYKVAQTVNMLIDPYADGIDSTAQNEMIKILSGEAGTWHAGSPTAQRVANGEGDFYSPNPLTNPESYIGYESWLDSHMQDDMVWYYDPNQMSASADEQINEVLEHLMHTMHLFGVRGAVEGSYTALMGRDIEVETSENYKNQDLYLAMKEARTNGVFNPEYDTLPDNVLLKEYTYLLNYNMWELGKVFWEDDNGDGLGSLAPEWSDDARTPSSILENNPRGHALFEKYFEPVLSRPDVETLSNLFQDQTVGASEYSVGSEAVPGSSEFLLDVEILIA